MNTAIYIRVSHEEQVQGHSLFQQQSQCERFAINKGLKNIRVYSDEGKTATNMNRKELKKLIKDIECNKVDTLIVNELDRLSRNISDSEYFINLILLKNIKFYTVADDVKVENADDRLMFRFKIALAQHTSEKIGEKTISGLKGGLGKGEYIFSTPPIGYKRVGKILEPIESEIETVKYIFNLYLEGNSVKDITKFVDYSQSKIAKVLRNEKYTGGFHYRDNYYEGFGLLKLVTKKDFDNIQLILDANTKKKRYIYLFEKKLICANCNCYLEPKPTKKKNKVYIYYTCSNKLCNSYNKLANEEKLVLKFNKLIIRAIEKYIGPKAMENIDKVSTHDYSKDELFEIMEEYFENVKINF